MKFFFSPPKFPTAFFYGNVFFFCEEDNHVQVNPKLKVNQLRQMIDLEIMGIHIDLRAVDLVPRDQSLSGHVSRNVDLKIFAE